MQLGDVGACDLGDAVVAEPRIDVPLAGRKQFADRTTDDLIADNVEQRTLVWLAACGTLLHSLVERSDPCAEAVADKSASIASAAAIRRLPPGEPAGIQRGSGASATHRARLPPRRWRRRFAFFWRPSSSAASWGILAPANDMRDS